MRCLVKASAMGCAVKGSCSPRHPRPILFLKQMLQICLLAEAFNPFKVIFGNAILLTVFCRSYSFFVPHVLPASIYKYKEV